MGHNTHHNNEGLCCTVRHNRRGLRDMRNPGLARQARMAQEEQDSYQSAPSFLPPASQYADARDDSAGSASGAPAYGAPGPAPHAGPDHVDYGAYTGGYGAFGWY